MKNLDLKPEECVKNPMILKLLEALKGMPQYLEERSARIKRNKKLIREVWEGSMLQAGFLKKPLDPNE